MGTKVFFLACLLCTALLSHGQNDLRRIDVSSLPVEIRDLQDISLALRWTDNLGDNVVVITQRTQRAADNAELRKRTSDLVVKKSFWNTDKGTFSDRFKEASAPFAYHFLVKDDSAILWRKTAGTGMNCNIRTQGNRLKSAVVVTDLDRDHTAEVWFIVKAQCVDDEGPSGMKIVMTTGAKRYLMSGRRVIQLEGQTVGGEYHFDEAFQNAPADFKRYAVQLWQRNIHN